MSIRNVAACAAAILTLAGCASTTGASTAGTSSQACLTNAPGGKLCGGDAKSFCQEMRTGQTVNPASVGATTKRECAALGVRGLR